MGDLDRADPRSGQGQSHKGLQRDVLRMPRDCLGLLTLISCENQQ